MTSNVFRFRKTLNRNIHALIDLQCFSLNSSVALRGCLCVDSSVLKSLSRFFAVEKINGHGSLGSPEFKEVSLKCESGKGTKHVCEIWMTIWSLLGPWALRLQVGSCDRIGHYWSSEYGVMSEVTRLEWSSLEECASLRVQSRNRESSKATRMWNTCRGFLRCVHNKSIDKNNS